MEFRVSGDWRTRQTRGYATFTPLYPRTDKSELTKLFPDSILSSITALDNPLQKNLADSYVTDRSGQGKHDTSRGEIYDSREGTKMNGKRELDLGGSQQQPQRRGEFFPALFGFTSYIAGFFHNITGAMPFHHSRPPSPEKAPPEAARAFTLPEDIYYDSEPVDSGFDEGWERDASPPIDEVDAIGHFSRRDCAKNSGEANRNEADVGRAQCDARGGAGSDQGAPGDMSGPEDVHAAAEHCRGKMARIQELLARKNLEALRSTKTAKASCGRPRPRRVYVEPKAVSLDSSEPMDPEPLGRIENVVATNFVNPGLVAESELARVDNHPRVKLEDESKGATSQAKPVNIDDSREITKTIHIVETGNDVSDKSGAENIEIKVKPAVVEKKYRVSDETKVIAENACGLRDARRADAPTSAPTVSETKAELIASCEDKVSRLKALLFERKKKNREPQHSEESQRAREPSAEAAGFARKADTRRSPDRPIPAPTRRQPSRHHKNPHRLDARKQSRKQLRRNIDEDARLASDLESGSISEDGDSPKQLGSGFESPKPAESGFDEIRGQFGPKDDPFVIVFSESPPASPAGSPRSRLPSDCGSDDSFIICFEDEEGGSACCFTAELESESDASDSESDSGCESNLASVGQSFSRTVSDLTDESLYRDDGESPRSVAVEDVDEVEEEGAGGMLLTEAKKIARRSLPAKRVRFSEAPPRVRVMRVWLYAARQARAGNWRQLAIDNERFKRRIADVDMAISWVLKPQHRSRVKFQRFMPWWHAQRRQEAAERKVAAEKIEEERIAEEARIQEEIRAEEERIAEKEENKQQATQVFGEENNVDNGNVVITIDTQEENVKEFTNILKEDLEIKNNANTSVKTTQIENSVDSIVVMKEKEVNEKCKENSLRGDMKYKNADDSKLNNDKSEKCKENLLKGSLNHDDTEASKLCKDKNAKCKNNSIRVDIKHENADDSKLDNDRSGKRKDNSLQGDKNENMEVSKQDSDKSEINLKSAGQVQIDVNSSKTANIDPMKLLTKANCTNVIDSNLDSKPNFANPAKTDILKVENFINATNKGLNIRKNGVVSARTFVIEKKS